ncbi:hypothetical protein DXX93_14395 [Thalassotalea euphylliae]|uniref:Uncharacterized protein n=1 Tax=Thalassotalea euphylliae TaxID=1655234 RepID=A0A3E0TTF7_9GAMM|nr:hypothetical protein DXX93_14395 [Thalassotalea euphylliae]
MQKHQDGEKNSGRNTAFLIFAYYPLFATLLMLTDRIRNKFYGTGFADILALSCTNAGLASVGITSKFYVDKGIKR